MKILYIHQYFGTPDIPGPTRAYWNCKQMMDNGHEVVVIRSSRKNKSFLKNENFDGIKIISLKVKYSNSMGVYRRFLAFLKFMTFSTWFAMKESDIDLVVASSTPLTIGFPALILKKVKKIPYVFEVRDLWPEVPIQMGAVKNKYVILVARWFEKTIYKNASKIIALSPGMKDGVISTGISSDKVEMIPNMSNIDIFYKRPHKKKLLNQFGVSNKSFKIIYFGALGLANSIDYILEAAKLLKDINDIEFLFIGEGAMLKNIHEEKNFHKLDNVKYLGFFTLEETSEVVNLCHVSIVTFGNLPILGTNSPTKLFDSLSAGKPILVNSAGWTKTLVEENDCGLYVDPESPEDLARKILYLKNSPEILTKMSENGRKLAETDFDKSVLCDKFYGVVENILSQK
jgi:glycosyltransferase involved in cell wall biosynthesis